MVKEKMPQTMQIKIPPKEIFQLEDTLRSFGIEFFGGDNEILIKGELRYANSFNGKIHMVIMKGDTKIVYSELTSFNDITIMNNDKGKSIIMPKSVTAYYNYPYLTILY
jgi:hypothetical protein